MRTLLTMSFVLVFTGCAGLVKSRYAMDDPVYAAKYEEGAKKSDLPGKLKQALDARHVEGLGGGYIGGGGQWRNNSQTSLVVLEIGSEGYATSWLSGRLAFAGYLGHEDWYAGVDSGARLQLPTRITPFAGVGLFNGLSTTFGPAEDDNLDNDDDGAVDEDGETDWDFDGWLTAASPAVGAHFWPSGQSRLTLFSRYMVTTDGRASDDWLTGFQFTTFSR